MIDRTGRQITLLNDPEIVTRGWVYAPEAEGLLGEAADAVEAFADRRWGGEVSGD